jgi:hypothetical protein
MTPSKQAIKKGEIRWLAEEVKHMENPRDLILLYTYTPT